MRKILIFGVFSISGFSPYGPQLDVPVTSVTSGGWRECFKQAYRDSFDSNIVTSIMESYCKGSDIMLACRKENFASIQLLAWAPRSCVFTNTTGTSGSVTTNCQGTEWYFSKSYSWGFAAGGDTVSKSSCDKASSGSPNKRLCFHTDGSTGYRCGNTGSSSSYELLIFQRGDEMI